MAIQYPDCTEASQDTHCKGMNQSCWDGYDESPYAYILFVPMTAALAVGTIYNRNNLKHLKHNFHCEKCSFVINTTFFSVSDKFTFLNKYCQNTTCKIKTRFNHWFRFTI